MRHDFSRRVPAWKVHLEATLNWLERSLDHGRGGAAEHYVLGTGWGLPAPGTTGELVPTLLALHACRTERGFRSRAFGCGAWLAAIADSSGAWRAGEHQARERRPPSVRTTAQVVLGLVALGRCNRDRFWIETALRAAEWIEARERECGAWANDESEALRAREVEPLVAHAFAELAAASGAASMAQNAERAEGSFAARLSAQPLIFEGGAERNVHTTRELGLILEHALGAALVAGDRTRVSPQLVAALGRLCEIVHHSQGQLAAELANPDADGDLCPEGNARLALALLSWNALEPDPRFLQAAARLVDAACATQSLGHAFAGLRGSVSSHASGWSSVWPSPQSTAAARAHATALAALLCAVEARSEPPAPIPRQHGREAQV